MESDFAISAGVISMWMGLGFALGQRYISRPGKTWGYIWRRAAFMLAWPILLIIKTISRS